jgi:DNA-binding NarL/FixJ family response regulator
MEPVETSSAARPVRVLTVDDQAIFRVLARDVIEATPGFLPVGEAADGASGLDAVEQVAPDLVIVDVRMPGMDGVEVARRLVATHPEVLVVLVSIEDAVDVPSVRRLSGVRFVRKQEFGPRLLQRVWKERATAGMPPGHPEALPPAFRRG